MMTDAENKAFIKIMKSIDKSLGDIRDQAIIQNKMYALILASRGIVIDLQTGEQKGGDNNESGGSN